MELIYLSVGRVVRVPVYIDGVGKLYTPRVCYSSYYHVLRLQGLPVWKM